MKIQILCLCMVAISIAAAAITTACDGRITPSGVGSTEEATVAATPTLSAHDASVATARASDAAFATSFDDYPVLWLGTGYDSTGDGAPDMLLEGADVRDSAARNDPRTGRQLSPDIRSLSVRYGTCEIPPRKQSCTIPINIQIYPSDSELPEPVGTYQHVPVRGVEAAVYDGGDLWIVTADFTVVILPSFAPDGEERLNQSLRIASLLYGANAQAAWITKDTDFRPRPTPTATPLVFPTDTPAPHTATPTPYPIFTPPPEASETAPVPGTVGAE